MCLAGTILALCLLVACGQFGGKNTPQAPADGALPPPAGESILCRVIAGAEEGNLLLAKQGGGGGDVYRLSVWDCPITLDGQTGDAAALENGTLVEIWYSGDVLETFPAQLASVAALDIRSAGFDNRCVLYGTVLEDLWAVDEGLNSDLTELGVDLYQTTLDEAEQAAVAWAFGEAHGLVPVQGTWDELAERGYIDRENLQWERGCLFSIADQPVKGHDSRNTLLFDAQKWRSGTGAYFFDGCTAKRPEGGAWGAYTVDSEVIS